MNFGHCITALLRKLEYSKNAVEYSKKCRRWLGDVIKLQLNSVAQVASQSFFSNRVLNGLGIEHSKDNICIF